MQSAYYHDVDLWVKVLHVILWPFGTPDFDPAWLLENEVTTTIGRKYIHVPTLEPYATRGY